MAPENAALIEPQRVNERLEALRHECIRQKDLIYRCIGVPATESLPFLNRIIDLSLTLQGIGSMDTVADVIESKVGQRIVTSAEKLMEPTVWWRCVECKKALGYAPTYWGRDGRSGPPCIYCGAVTEQIERPTPCGTS